MTARIHGQMTTLARTRSNCKRLSHPIVREGAPRQQTRNCLKIIKIWSWAPDTKIDWPTERSSQHNFDLMGLNLVSYCCQKLVAEPRRQFGKPEEGERPPLEAATKQRQ
jgi:hypothetical protein